MKPVLVPNARPYLPDRTVFERYVDGIYERRWLTNNGTLVQDLTRRLEQFLGVSNLLLVANGTLALQVALRTLCARPTVGSRNAVTTPFTFVATSSALAWEGVTPRFVDIDESTWCVRPDMIENAIDESTVALVPVHVFGNACDVAQLETIARRRGLSLIYDAAHAFAVEFGGGRSLLGFGDAAALSFHATKLFHTVEGGAIVFRRSEDLDRARKIINFGITGPSSIEELGINAKMSEFHAAMGHALLDEYALNRDGRRRVWEAYERGLSSDIRMQAWHPQASQNYAYFPVQFANASQRHTAQQAMRSHGIEARRYFYPSLDTLPLGESVSETETSRRLADTVLCLPLFHDVPGWAIETVIREVRRAAAS